MGARMVDEQTTEELPQETGMAERPRWLFWSTRDSIEHDVPSIAAIIETALAAPLFWWLAGHVGFYLPLLISMAVAPFVLLRSDESVKLGLRWFLKWHERKGTFGFVSPRDRYLGNEAEISLVNATTRSLIAVASAGGALVVVISSIDYFQRFFQTSIWLSIIFVFWSSLFIFDLTALVLSALASFVIVGLSVTWMTGKGLLITLAGNLAVGIVGAFALTIALSRSGMMSMIISVAVGIFVGFLMTFMLVLRQRLMDRQSTATVFLFPLQFFFDVPGLLSYALFIFGETALIRMSATIVYLHKGLESLPQNFRRLVICTSPAQVPELIPGLDAAETKLHWFTLAGSLSVIETIRRHFGPVWVAQTSIQTALIFLPAWLYRITLKSTFWFWWPLTLLGGEVRYARDPGLYHERAVKSLWGVTGIVLSLLTVIAFIFTNLIATGGIFHPNPLLNAMGYVFLIDWSAPPWQLLSLASALLSLFIILRLDYVFREYRYAVDHGREEIRSKTDRKFFIVELATRVRFILFLAFWMIVGGHTFLYLNSLDCWLSKIPNSIEEVGRMVYGKRMPPLTCRLLCRTTVPELILSIPLLMGIRMGQP